MKPNNNSNKQSVSRWTVVKKKALRILYMIGLLGILSLGILVYFKYFYTYSEGYRAGLLQKFSRKGNIFKTYEGELILSSVSSTSNVAIASEKFYFSVTEKDLAGNLDTIQGLNVIVHYRQKHAPLFWKGDTPYYVDSVKVR